MAGRQLAALDGDGDALQRQCNEMLLQCVWSGPASQSLLVFASACLLERQSLRSPCLWEAIHECTQGCIGQDVEGVNRLMQSDATVPASGWYRACMCYTGTGKTGKMTATADDTDAEKAVPLCACASALVVCHAACIYSAAASVTCSPAASVAFSAAYTAWGRGA